MDRPQEALELTAVLWAAPGGGFSALNPETGTTSEGETQTEALSNLAEATALYLEECPLPRGERPVVTTFNIADSRWMVERDLIDQTVRDPWESTGRVAGSPQARRSRS